jgi:hypothetical protein
MIASIKKGRPCSFVSLSKFAKNPIYHLTYATQFGGEEKTFIRADEKLFDKLKKKR